MASKDKEKAPSEPPKYFVTRTIAFTHTRALKPRVIRVTKDEYGTWNEDTGWRDEKPACTSRPEAERRARSYATIERFDTTVKEGRNVSVPTPTS